MQSSTEIRSAPPVHAGGFFFAPSGIAERSIRVLFRRFDCRTFWAGRIPRRIKLNSATDHQRAPVARANLAGAMSSSHRAYA
jgi:hypothetical protein